MSTKAGNRPQNRTTHKERVPVDGMRDIMTVHGKDSGFKYRWVTDTDERGSRIWKFKRGGWEFATLDGHDEEIQVGQEAVYKSADEGNLVRLHTGEGRFSYLMRIPKEYYDEDQIAKEERIQEQEDGIMGTQTSQGDANNGQYGSVKFEK
jgi:hypothetical protein